MTHNLLFFQIYRKGFINLLLFFFSPASHEDTKAFFIHLRTVLSSLAQKKLPSHYFPLVNERHKTVVNTLYP